VTNGPLLRVEAAGKLPGHVFTAPEGREVSVEIKAKLTGPDPIRFFEIIKNGQVERKVPLADWEKTGTLGTVRFQGSGWFLVDWPERQQHVQHRRRHDRWDVSGAWPLAG